MFALDQRLENDTLLVGDFELCRLLLMNDNRYPWFILVPKREDITEVFQLSDQEQLLMWQEATRLAEVLKDTFKGDKVNIASLGNVVSQLHVHVIVRKKTDAAWPSPVWGQGSAVPYNAEQITSVCEKLRMVLTDSFLFLNRVAKWVLSNA